jgi:Replication-relaxation
MYPRLTTRDIAVLKDVYRYRYLSGTQIAKLHFPSQQTMWRRIRALTDLNLLKSFIVHNIPERIFYLDKKGAVIVACELSLDFDDLGWHRTTKQPRDYYFLKHFLSLNDFQILLSNACQKHNMTLMSYIPEYVGKQTKQGYVTRLIRDTVGPYAHTPDAVFSLRKDDKPALFFVEIDRGNEVVSDPARGLLKAIIFYLHYWTSDHWHQYNGYLGGDFKTFRALIITTSKERIQHIREATSNYPFHDALAKRFLWATTEQEATEDWIFEGIWRSLDVNDQTLYRIG